jgi:predicted transposase YbfD/YdcC
MAGADDWVAVVQYGRRKKEWLKSFLELPHGIPSHDTFNELFSRLDPEPFEMCFMEWMKELVQISNGRLIAIDGKSLRRSFEHGWDKSGMAHIVSAFLSANRMVFAQVKTEGKGHELDGVEKLLEILDLRGAVVTIDALGCNRRIAELVMLNKGDYILQVKKNQEALLGKLQATMDEAILLDFKGMEHDCWTGEMEADHGRIERRKVWVTWDLSGLGALAKQWKGLKCLIVVECASTRYNALGVEETTLTRHYYISSLDRRHGAQRIGRYVRGHWGVENNLHWQLDVSFNEDQRRLRVGHGAENFSRLCRMALNLLKHEKTAKCGIANKRKNCGYTEKVTFHIDDTEKGHGKGDIPH